MKQSEVNKQSIEGLKEHLKKYKTEYADLKLLHAVTPIDNPMKIRQMRRTIARISTAITQKDKSTTVSL